MSYGARAGVCRASAYASLSTIVRRLKTRGYLHESVVFPYRCEHFYRR